MAKEYKPGGVVENTFVQENESGQIVSEASIRWYGFDEAGANMASMGLIKSTFDTVDGWREEKVKGNA